MGNRVHQVIGYGFKHVKHLKDPRFNTKFWEDDFLEEECYERLLAHTKKKVEAQGKKRSIDTFLFLSWLEGKEKNPPKNLTVSDFIASSGYATEMEISPIVFGCFKQDKDWYRYDDIIDYYTAEREDGCPKDTAKYITNDYGEFSGIYPHLSFCNRINGKVLNITPMDKSIAGKYGDKELFKTNSIANQVQWQRNIVPKVPAAIEIFCECLEVFKNPTTVYRLKPMIYTFWC